MKVRFFGKKYSLDLLPYINYWRGKKGERALMFGWFKFGGEISW